MVNLRPVEIIDRYFLRNILCVCTHWLGVHKNALLETQGFKQILALFLCIGRYGDTMQNLESILKP